jgi:hypothetical protein
MHESVPYEEMDWRPALMLMKFWDFGAYRVKSKQLEKNAI